MIIKLGIRSAQNFVSDRIRIRSTASILMQVLFDFCFGKNIFCDIKLRLGRSSVLMYSYTLYNSRRNPRPLHTQTAASWTLLDLQRGRY
jgi:hypothetical protein